MCGAIAREKESCGEGGESSRFEVARNEKEPAYVLVICDGG